MSKEQFDYRRIPLDDILIATKNFAEENLIKRGGKAEVYKGVLLRSKVAIDVVIRKYSGNVFNFYGGILRISSLRHRNIVSFIGFCDEKDERMIVMEHVVNGSLDIYLSDSTTLTWYQRMHICFGAARALMVSKNAYSFKILLDKDWEAKVQFDIESKIEISSATYCLGVILLEVLYRRKVTIEDVKKYLAKMKENPRYEEVDDMIDPNLRKQMHPQSLAIFSKTAYDCLKENRADNTNLIENDLREALDIQWKHENVLWMENYAHLKIPLRQIILATDNFSIWNTCYKWMENGRIPMKKSIPGIWKGLSHAFDFLLSNGIDFWNKTKVKVSLVSSIGFWQDNWATHAPLRSSFPNLYNIERSKSCTVAERLGLDNSGTSITWSWTRPPSTPCELDELDRCTNLILNHQFENSEDTWEWTSKTDKQFHSSDIRKELEEKMWGSYQFIHNWLNWVPKKVDIFVWRAALNRIPSKHELEKRGIDLQNKACSWCACPVETTNHILLQCQIAKLTWEKNSQMVYF